MSRVLLGLLLCLTLVGAHAEVRVLTSIKPLQLIAAAVQDGVGAPEVLLPPGASPHNFALRPSDVRRVQEVELLYWIGPDMESFLPRVLSNRSLPNVPVQNLPGLHLRHFGEEHGAESEHDDHDEHGHDELAHDGRAVHRIGNDGALGSGTFTRHYFTFFAP